MNDIEIIVTGNVATDVSLNFTKSGTPVAHFRVASASRRFDRSQERWIDGDTHFFSISCFRDLAQNVVQSLEKGQPIMLKGRLRSREVLRECGEQMHTQRYFDIEASSVGHDLSRGAASFTRVKRESVVESERRAVADVLAASGLAEDDAAIAEAHRILTQGHASEPDDDVEVVDPETGEILDPAVL